MKGLPNAFQLILDYESLGEPSKMAKDMKVVPFDAYPKIPNGSRQFGYKMQLVRNFSTQAVGSNKRISYNSTNESTITGHWCSGSSIGDECHQNNYPQYFNPKSLLTLNDESRHTHAN